MVSAVELHQKGLSLFIGITDERKRYFRCGNSHQGNLTHGFGPKFDFDVLAMALFNPNLCRVNPEVMGFYRARQKPHEFRVGDPHLLGDGDGRGQSTAQPPATGGQIAR